MSGIIDECKTNFENAGVSVTVYDKVESNPKDYNVMDAYEAYSEDELQKMAEHMMGDLCTPVRLDLGARISVGRSQPATTRTKRSTRCTVASTSTRILSRAL